MDNFLKIITLPRKDIHVCNRYSTKILQDVTSCDQRFSSGVITLAQGQVVKKWRSLPHLKCKQIECLNKKAKHLQYLDRCSAFYSIKSSTNRNFLCSILDSCI